MSSCFSNHVDLRSPFKIPVKLKKPDVRLSSGQGAGISASARHAPQNVKIGTNVAYNMSCHTLQQKICSKKTLSLCHCDVMSSDEQCVLQPGWFVQYVSASAQQCALTAFALSGICFAGHLLCRALQVHEFRVSFCRRWLSEVDEIFEFERHMWSEPHIRFGAGRQPRTQSTNEDIKRCNFCFWLRCTTTHECAHCLGGAPLRNGVSWAAQQVLVGWYTKSFAIYFLQMTVTSVSLTFLCLCSCSSRSTQVRPHEAREESHRLPRGIQICDTDVSHCRRDAVSGWVCLVSYDGAAYRSRVSARSHRECGRWHSLGSVWEKPLRTIPKNSTAL